MNSAVYLLSEENQSLYMMNRFNSGLGYLYYSHINIHHLGSHTSCGKQKHVCLKCENQWSSFLCCQQEPMRFVLVRQECSFELLFMFADQCLYVKKTKLNLFILLSDRVSSENLD